MDNAWRIDRHDRNSCRVHKRLHASPFCVSFYSTTIRNCILLFRDDGVHWDNQIVSSSRLKCARMRKQKTGFAWKIKRFVLLYFRGRFVWQMYTSTFAIFSRTGLADTFSRYYPGYEYFRRYTMKLLRTMRSLCFSDRTVSDCGDVSVL